MKQKFLQKAKIMARDAGYHDVRVLKPWHGYEVVEPIFTDDIVRYIGFPQYILVKDGMAQWATPEQCEALMERSA